MDLSSPDVINSEVMEYFFLPKPFLTCSVPNLQFDHFADDIDDLGTKLHSNCVIGFILN